MITDTELDGMRETAEADLTDAVTFQDRSTAPDIYGGHSEALTPRVGSVKARLGWPTRDEARVFASQFQDEATAMLSLPWDTDVDAGDRITLASNGATYEITAAPPTGTRGTVRRVVVKEVD